MAKGYGYGNARLRAMRSRLLGAADYQDLLTRNNPEELIARLAETPYAEDVEAALLQYGGMRCIYEAMRTNLTRTLSKMREFYEDEPLELIDILLRRWDRHNLLVVLRGQSQGVAPEVILAATVPAGGLDAVALRELARQPGLRAAVDLMSTWRLPYAEVLRGVRARAGAVPDLDQLELALNRAHYSTIRAVLERGDRDQTTVLELILTEIDLTNIGTLLRLVRLPELVILARQRFPSTDVSPLLIKPGGHLPAERLAGLLGEDTGLEGVVRGLSDTRYGAALDAGWRRYQAEAGGVPVIERELQRWSAQHSAQLYHGDPLSIAIPAGYLGLKETEVANVRLVAHAVALRMAPERAAGSEQVRRDLIIL